MPSIPRTELLYAWAYERIFYGAWQPAVRGRRIGAHTARLAATQWLGPEAVAAAQAADLRALLLHAQARVPYYRELFARERFDPRGVRGPEDLAVLPLLTRDIIRERYDDLLDPSRADGAIYKETSGSTGVPLRFEYCSESETWRQAARVRAYRWAGYRPGVRTLHYWGTGTHPPHGLKAAKVSIDRAIRREQYVDAARQDEASNLRTAALIARTRPRVIVAYAQALASLARWVLDRGARAWDDVAIVAGAEPMSPADRAAMERAFGPVFETYGSRETMLIAAECEAHEGMHVTEENLVVEVLRDGRPVAPGETGTVVITDLHNYRMPFVRYVNGDAATAGPRERCACGRGLGRLMRVDGRVSDTLRDRNGASVPGMVFISLLNTHEAELREFQAVQRVSGAIELKIVPGRAWSEERFAPTVRRLAGYFEGLPFKVVHVDAIPADPSGKRRPVVVERAAE